MSRPLVVIFLTVFVNLVGFGIIIPLLPFYAETFGASPVVIGLLFAAFSLAQIVAAPILGALSDRFGRRPILIFSLIGTVISFAMLAVWAGLSFSRPAIRTGTSLPASSICGGRPELKIRSLTLSEARSISRRTAMKFGGGV